MNDLTKLTAEELLRGKTSEKGYVWFSAETFEEICRRLKRLEQCEAALKPFAERAKAYLAKYGRYAAQTDTIAVPFEECDAARAALEGK